MQNANLLEKDFLSCGISSLGVALKRPFGAIRLISFHLYVFPYTWFTVPPPWLVILSLETLRTEKFTFYINNTSRRTAG